MKFKPRPYQSRAITFGIAHPVCALLLDMGLGKTAVALSIIHNDIDTCESIGCLIVAPPSVVNNVWAQEVQKWGFNLSVAPIVGSAAQREDVLRTGKADVYLISYANLIWLADWLHDNKPPFDGIIFDESSCMKSAQSKRFKRIRPFMPFMRRRMILTGTPAAESLVNLFSQYYLLDQGERLGKYITHFTQEHYRSLDRFGYKLKLKIGHDEIIYSRVKDITLSLRSEDHLKLPEVISTVISVPLPEKVMAQYEKFEKDMFLEMGANKVEALNAATLSVKCRQFTSGALYSEKGFDIIHTAKMNALEEFIDQLDGQPLLVAYEFRHEAARFAKQWPKAPILGGGTKAADVTKAIAAWNTGRVPLMFIQPASVGHGVNLQDGGHKILWFSTTWSGERYVQTIKRIHRSGQKSIVTVHHLVCPKTIDTLVLQAQKRKTTGQADLMAALNSYRKESTLRL